MPFVVLDQVCGHLQGRVYDHPVCYLPCQRGLYAAFRVGPVPLDPSLVGLRCGIVDVEDSRSVVHRSAQHPHEGQRREILCRIPFRPCVPFHAPRPFACHHVGPRASYPRLLYRLVYVEHDPVFRRRFHDPLIVLHSILRMMEVTAFESPCISRFERVNPQFGIPPHRCFQDGFVLRNISSRFVVHPQLHALFTGIGGYSLQIEIRIGFEVVELLVSAPVLPSFVPALEQHSLYAVFRSKVDVPDGIPCRCSVSRPHRPYLRSEVHSPPYADVLLRHDP